MSKLVEIDRCKDCGHRNYCDGWGYYECRLSGREYSGRGFEIPSDCPLPNAPEGAHCADTPKTAKAEGNV